MLLLACSAAYVAYVDYLSHGFQPLFVAMLLGVASCTGWCLWEDPDAGGAALPDPGGGPDGAPGGDPSATAARAGATRTAAGGARAGSGDPRPPRGTRVREKVAADVE